MSKVAYKDFLGKTIKKGATIVYPVRAGSAMWMKKGTVLRRAKKVQHYTLNIDNDPCYTPILEVETRDWANRTCRVKIEALERCVVVG